MKLKSILACLAASALALGLAAAEAGNASYLWLESPQKTNFNATPKWDILSGGKAVGVMPELKAPEAPFAEYEFDMPSPGGETTLWGRAYDPSWSSQARWRLDDSAWQEWKPGDASDRTVFKGVFAMEWRPWGKLSLAPGRHSLRIELTEGRKHDAKMFFVLDALLLAKGRFQPKGALKPDEIAKQKADLVEAEAKSLGDEARPFIERAAKLSAKALQEDLGAFDEFNALFDDVEKAKETQKLLANNRMEKLHGRIESVKWEGGALLVESAWNRPFDGEMWIGFKQGGALYAAVVEPLKRESKHSFSLRVPKLLPKGEIAIQCVPIGQPVAAMPSKSFMAPEELAAGRPLALAWGVYRDSSLRVHPWNVSEGGMMLWDGKPFIPVGGMMNTRSSWTTKAGDSAEPSLEILKAQLAELRKYGIKDVYYNAFFLRSNPNALAEVVNATEEAGMRYGLHVSSLPEDGARSLGFFSQPAAELEEGVGSHEIRVPVQAAQVRPPQRCLWALVSPDGGIVESGAGALKAEAHQEQPDAVEPKGKKKRRKADFDLVFTAKFKAAPPKGSTLFSSAEFVMPANEPSGFLEGVDEYLSKLREVYGSLRLGPGMRLWIDPFQNEFHGSNRGVSSGPEFSKGFARFLLERHERISQLNKAWSPDGAEAESFSQAARLQPLGEHGGKILCADSESGKAIAFSSMEILHDISDYKGKVSEEMVSRAADTLKSIADVPVILKHNCWFSPWFANPRKAGGQDGLGYEAYCYGDSLAYHNTLAPLAEAMASGRRQWTLTTETSAAAFDGQKDYVGYLDRLQMLNDFDQLAKFGSKGVYSFGFAFDPPNNFQVTELLRDPRQLEWMASYSKLMDAAAPRLASYMPEVYAWDPVSLHEGELLGQKLSDYEMDGHYFATSGQIRMAPDGRWIIPAFRPDAQWLGILAPWRLLGKAQREALRVGAQAPVWALGVPQDELKTLPPSWKTLPLDGFTASGIGAIPPKPRAMTLDEFREKVLGYRVFQTSDINGCSMPDGRLMVWTCVERQSASLKLPAGASACDLRGKALELGGDRTLSLTREPYEKSKGELPAYLRHLPKGYFHIDNGQPELAIVSGAAIDAILALNPPAWHRWLPSQVKPEAATAWIEAEDFAETSFNQPRVEGYSRYSGGSAIGINGFLPPPEGKAFFAKYQFKTSKDSSKLWIRKMDKPAMDLEAIVDGKPIGGIAASEPLSDSMHLNPWNAGTGVNNISAGWVSLSLPEPLKPGAHSLTLLAKLPKGQELKSDSMLIGKKDAKAEAEADIALKRLQCVQIDVLMLSR